MSLFGKKDGTNSGDNNDDLPPVAAGDDAVFDETADTLAAPSRPEMKSGGGRKNLLLLVLLLLVAGGGAGYFYLSSQEEEAYVAAAPQPDPAAATDAPADAAAVSPETVPQDPSAPVTADASQSPADGSVVTPPESDPLAAMPPQPDPTAPADPLAAVSTPVAETVPTTMPEMPPMPEPAAPAATTAGDDLPVPQSEEAIALPTGAVSPATPPAGADATITTTADGTTTTVTTTAGGAAPSEGELAIVNNATTLSNLPATQGAANDPIGNLASQQAMIRPLPKQYLVVHKNHTPSEIDTRLTTARLALSQGRSQAAFQIFNELYKDYPRDKRVLMGRAVALQKLGQTGEALVAYEELLTRDPKNLEALTNMLGLLKKENPSLAVAKLVELREAYPFNADVTAQLGIAYAGTGEYEEALKFLDMSEALKPGSALVLYNKGVLLDKMGRSAEAAGIYRQLIRMSADGMLDQSLPVDTLKRRLAVMR